MRLRLTILRTEVKLFGLFAADLVFLNPAALVLVVYFPLFLFFLWALEGRLYLTPIIVYVSILLVAVIINVYQRGADRASADPPLQWSLSSDPALHDYLQRIAARWRKTAPRNAIVSLSPVAWRTFGVDLRSSRHNGQGLPLPVTCLDTWSVSDFETYVARTLVSHHGPSWLLAAVEAAIERLCAEQYLALRSRTLREVRVQGRLLHNYIATLRAWRFLVDLEADLRVAGKLGADAVISLAYKTELANVLAPHFIKGVLLPALEKQMFLPIASAYAAYASALDPYWRDAVRADLKKTERASRLMGPPIVARLAILANAPSGVSVQDPRPAASIFNNYEQLERDAAIHEFGRQRVESAARVDSSDWARLAVIPQLRDEVNRNDKLLRGKTRADIPDLLRRKADLAPEYRSDPKFLLALIQKQARIAYLLGAFLTLNLVDEQWSVSFAAAGGIQVRSGHRQIQPFTLVNQLDAQTISDADFLEAVK